MPKRVIFALMIVGITALAFLRFQTLLNKTPEQVFKENEIVIPEGMEDEYAKVYEKLLKRIKNKNTPVLKEKKENISFIENKIKNFYTKGNGVYIDIYLYNNKEVPYHGYVSLLCEAISNGNVADTFSWSNRLSLPSKKAALITNLKIGSKINEYMNIDNIKCSSSQI